METLPLILYIAGAMAFALGTFRLVTRIDPVALGLLLFACAFIVRGIT